MNDRKFLQCNRISASDIVPWLLQNEPTKGLTAHVPSVELIQATAGAGTANDAAPHNTVRGIGGIQMADRTPDETKT